MLCSGLFIIPLKTARRRIARTLAHQAIKMFSQDGACGISVTPSASTEKVWRALLPADNAFSIIFEGRIL